MLGNAGYTIDEVVESVDKNLWGLTCFAEFRSEDKELGKFQMLSEQASVFSEETRAFWLCFRPFR